MRQYVVDRSRWQRGPWDSEPDHVDWVDDTTGLRCAAWRSRSSGHWCGYVEIPEGHSLHGVGVYDSSPALAAILSKRLETAVDVGTLGLGELIGVMRGELRPCPGEAFTVHGGVTFSGHFDSTSDWWIGFDCSHHRDVTPIDTSWCDGDYRSLSYVRGECRELAKQIAEVAS